MALVNALFDPMLDTLGTEVAEASLHTAEPDASGSDEVSGGSYTRLAVSWDPASGGQIDASAQLDFSVPGGNTVSWLGLWDGSGAWLGSIELSNAESYAAAGNYTVTLLRVVQTDTAAA